MTTRWIAVAVASGALLVACGDSDSDDGAGADVVIDDDTSEAGEDTFSLTLPDVTAEPEVDSPPAPIAGVCLEDDDCASGYCNTWPSGGYCTQRCGGDQPECPEGSVCLYAEDSDGAKRNLCFKECISSTQCRLDQFCPQEALICSPRCQPGMCSDGLVCDLDTGRCVDEAPCSPVPEICDDGKDQDCDGYVDNGCGPGIVAPAHAKVVDMGRARVGGGGLSRTFSYIPSEGSSSLTVIALADDHLESYMTAYALSGPGGVSLLSPDDTGIAPNASYPSYGAYTVQVPNSDRLDLERGLYSWSFYRYPEDEASVAPYGDVWVYAIENLRDAPTASAIDANLWFVGTPGLDATTAPNDARFQSLVEAFRGVMAGLGITVEQIRYFNVTGSDATRFTIVDTTDDGTVDEHAELLALSGSLPADNHGVNFFFVQGFTGWGLLGKAGGIPGPPLVHGTYESGVAVSLADYYEYPEEVVIHLTAETMAHELGHQLGLYHTTEQDGLYHDHILDTDECPAAQYDTNGDKLVDPMECAVHGALNLMFWTSSLSTQLSIGQRGVVHANPQMRDR